MGASVAAPLVDNLIPVLRENALLALAPLGCERCPLRELNRVRQELLDFLSRLIVRPLLLPLDFFHLCKQHQSGRVVELLRPLTLLCISLLRMLLLNEGVLASAQSER